MDSREEAKLRGDIRQAVRARLAEGTGVSDYMDRLNKGATVHEVLRESRRGAEAVGEIARQFGVRIGDVDLRRTGDAVESDLIEKIVAATKEQEAGRRWR